MSNEIRTSFNAWINKQIMELWYVHVNEYCAMIKNKILNLKKYMETCRCLECILLSGMSTLKRLYTI